MQGQVSQILYRQQEVPPLHATYACSNSCSSGPSCTSFITNTSRMNRTLNTPCRNHSQKSSPAKCCRRQLHFSSLFDPFSRMMHPRYQAVLHQRVDTLPQILKSPKTRTSTHHSDPTIGSHHLPPCLVPHRHLHPRHPSMSPLGASPLPTSLQHCSSSHVTYDSCSSTSRSTPPYTNTSTSPSRTSGAVSRSGAI